MISTNRRWLVLGVSAGLAIAATFLAAQAQEPSRRTRAEFMRMKLEYSKQVLEGLTLEEYPKIVQGAKALKKLSQAAE